MTFVLRVFSEACLLTLPISWPLDLSEGEGQLDAAVSANPCDTCSYQCQHKECDTPIGKVSAEGV